MAIKIQKCSWTVSLIVLLCLLLISGMWLPVSAMQPPILFFDSETASLNEALDTGTTTTVPSLDLNTADYSDYAAQAIELVNELRVAHGVEPLQVYWVMRELAEARAEEISKNFSDMRPDSTYVRDTHKYREIRTVNDTSPNAVIDSFMDDNVYKFMILDEGYLYAGIGCYQDENSVYHWVLLLSRK